MAAREQGQLTSAPPAALISKNPFAWLTVFGPGAIIASLTIGTGELIFSSRGGALFGYRVLFLFLVICICKWTLVFSTARHMVISGVHPLQRWTDLPLGPRGWFPAVLFVFAVVCIPIWVSFHASVIGDLLAWVTSTKHIGNGASVHLWGTAVLGTVVLLAFTGGYQALERVQLAIVAALLASVTLALVLLEPDWVELIAGVLVPQRLEFPAWLAEDPRPQMHHIASQPIWVEATLYVGVIGGASYDYLAYTSFLRDKKWGRAGSPESHLGEDAGDIVQVRRWTRAPLIDCTMSFLIVLFFSAVFVASGALVLGPQHEVPGDGSFLEHQAQFVTRLYPGLLPLYVVGAFLAMAGTLYGTLEVAPAILREIVLAMGSDHGRWESRVRPLAIGWCAAGALIVLAVSFVYQLASGSAKPPGLTQLLIPANLFTGVMSCGLICLFNPWMDRSLPANFRPPWILTLANIVIGILFICLGLKGYWDHSGWWAILILLGTVALGWLAAYVRSAVSD